MAGLRADLREFRRYPSAVFGVVFILALVVLAVYTMVAYPYDQVVKLWRAQGGDKMLAQVNELYQKVK